MALVNKQKVDLVQVPWSSPEEWLQVYKQIYSGNLEDQKAAYQTLIVWKTRCPILPVGVECTLCLIQVCLKDREWTTKIDIMELPITYENDLKMMYSKVVITVLNHINSTITFKKQSNNFFEMAKHFNIPQWIVEIRHDSAHGNELPSVDLMRIVVNILMTWLHEEYWSVRAKTIENSEDLEDNEDIDTTFDDQMSEIVELWTAVGLYIKANFNKVSDIPDAEFRESVKNLGKMQLSEPNQMDQSIFAFVNDNTELEAVSKLIIAEISKLLGKSRGVDRKITLIDSLFNNEVFLPSPEIFALFADQEQQSEDFLPTDLLKFWTHFIHMLQDKKVLSTLFLHLVELVLNENETKRKRLFASLWVKSLVQAIRKQKIAQTVAQTLEQNLESKDEKMSIKAFRKTVQEYMNSSHSELKDALWLNTSNDFVSLLSNSAFLERLILNVNEYSEGFVMEILKIANVSKINDNQEKLLKLIRIYMFEETNENDDDCDKIYTTEDLENHVKKVYPKPTLTKRVSDEKVRNTSWKLAERDCDWSSCPIGILPWRVNNPEKNSLLIPPNKVRYLLMKKSILPKIVDLNNLTVHSKIQWDKVSKKLNRPKKKTKIIPLTAVGTAMENVKIISEKNKAKNL